MSLALIIYLAEALDSFKYFCTMATWGFLVASLSIALFKSIENDALIFCKISKTLGVLSFVFILIQIITPSKDTVYLMAGANIATSAINSPEAAKARKALNLGLDKIIDNLQESK